MKKYYIAVLVMAIIAGVLYSGEKCQKNDPECGTQPEEVCSEEGQENEMVAYCDDDTEEEECVSGWGSCDYDPAHTCGPKVEQDCMLGVLSGTKTEKSKTCGTDWVRQCS